MARDYADQASRDSTSTAFVDGESQLQGPPPRIAVVKLGRIQPTETFIRSHIDRLPNVAGVMEIHGGDVLWGGRSVAPRGTLRRGVASAARRLRRQSWDDKVASEIRRTLRRSRAEVVLAEYGTTGAAIFPICREAGIRLVVHFHGYDATTHEVIERNAQAYQEMFGSADAVVVVSRAMRNQILRLGCPDDKVFVNVYGVDPPPPRPRDVDSIAFLAVGRFVEKKAPDLTVRAFARCRRRYPDARLRMIGDGPLLERCRQLSIAEGVSDAVEFLGAQPHDSVLSEMTDAFCMVQHSVVAPSGDTEGTPVAILEACAAGLPVIATRHAGIPDVIEEGVTGLLVDEHDVDAMGDAMISLLADQERAKQIGEAAQRFVRSRFNIDASLARLQSLLECVARGAPTPELEEIRQSSERLLTPVRAK